MILEHPEHRKTKRVKRWEHLKIIHLKAEGWKEREHERTPKQIAATKKWMASGQIERTRQNIMQVFRMELDRMTPDQKKALNNAEITLQQLIKKYQAPTT